MANLDLILFVLSFLLCVLAGLNIGHARVHLGWLGAACFVLTFIL